MEKTDDVPHSPRLPGHNPDVLAAPHRWFSLNSQKAQQSRKQTYVVQWTVALHMSMLVDGVMSRLEYNAMAWPGVTDCHLFGGKLD